MFNKENATIVETPAGIFTAAGLTFHTTKKELQAYAGEVFKFESLELLIAKSERWYRSPETVAIWLLPILLLNISVISSCITALLVYLVWQNYIALFYSRLLDRIFNALDLTVVQILYYALVLGHLGNVGAYAAVIAGSIAFFIFRWGLLKKPLLKVIKKWHDIPITDTILRTVIQRAAINYGVNLPELDAIEKSLLSKLR